MLWSEVKRWAKENGYESFREKIHNADNQYEYYWSKIDDVQCSGISNSVSKLAKTIYNNITNNQWTDHQESYTPDTTTNNISNYGS